VNVCAPVCLSMCVSVSMCVCFCVFVCVFICVSMSSAVWVSSSTHVHMRPVVDGSPSYHSDEYLSEHGVHRLG